MNNIKEILQGVKTAAIGGHVHPDGDCVGSCIGLFLYISRNFPDIRLDLYLEEPASVYSFLEGFDRIRTTEEPLKQYDLFITCDVSSRDRVGVGGGLFDQAKKTVCIDHHVSNTGFADINHIAGGLSSNCEVLYGLMDPEGIDCGTAQALYTGIIHDTGVFHYSSTTPETMRIAAALMEHGFDFSRILDETYYQKTYAQKQVLGRVLSESMLLDDGKYIIGCLRKKEMDFYGLGPMDMDGIVEQLRETKGVEASIFLYELEPDVFKVSFRSTGDLNVSETALFFGGGGHVKAAGCTIKGSFHDIVNSVMEQIRRQSL